MMRPQTMWTRVSVLAAFMAIALVARKLLSTRRGLPEKATLVTPSGEPLADDALLTDVDASITPERL